MSQTPPPPEDDDPHGALIEEGGHLVRWLIAEMRAILAGVAGQPPAMAFLRRLARLYLIPAVAVLRRAVHLIANTLPAITPKPASTKAAHPSAVGGPARQAPKPRAPVFRLTEPAHRPPTHHTPLHQRPRISVPGVTPDPPPKAPPARPDPARLEARLLRRLAALEAAWNAPVATARRLQRLRARKPAAPPKLAYLKVPGLKAGPLADLGQRILRDLNTAAFDAALNTS